MPDSHRTRNALRVKQACVVVCAALGGAILIAQGIRIAHDCGPASGAIDSAKAKPNSPPIAVAAPDMSPRPPSYEAFHLAFCGNDRTRLLASALNGSVLVDPIGGKVIRVYRTQGPSGHRYRVDAAGVAPDGSEFVTAAEEQTAIMWSIRTGELTGEFTLASKHMTHPIGVCFSHDGSRVIICEQNPDAVATVWDRRSGKKVTTLSCKACKYFPSSMVLAGKNQAVLSTDAGATVIWDMATGNTRELPGDEPIHRVAFDPIHNRIACALRHSGVVVWDLAGGKAIKKFPEGPRAPTAVAFTPDGKQVAVGGSGGAVQWDLASGEKSVLVDNVGQSAGATQVDAIAYPPDGSMVALALGNSTIVIRHPTSGELIQTIDIRSGAASLGSRKPDQGSN